MQAKQLKKAIRLIIKRNGETTSTKEARKNMSTEIMSLVEDEFYTLEEIQEEYNYFVENIINSGERHRYSDCVDMFVKQMQTGSTHPTLEELAD